MPAAKTPELAEPGERQITLRVKTQLPSVMLAFNVPSIATAEDKHSVHALRLIAALLDGGYSARIPTRLSAAKSWCPAARRASTPTPAATACSCFRPCPTARRKTIAQAEAGLWRLLEELKTTPPTAEELERVRAQVIAGLVYERDSITSQATAIGQLETVGLSWKLMDTELAELQSVTLKTSRRPLVPISLANA